MNFDHIEGAGTVGFAPLKIFEALLPQLSRARPRAIALESPNPEDDLPTRLGMIGFFELCPQSEWGDEQFRRLDTYRARELNAQAIAWHAEEGQICEEFSCYAFGHILGLLEKGEINATDVFLAESILPGFLFIKSGTFLNHPGAA